MSLQSEDLTSDDILTALNASDEEVKEETPEADKEAKEEITLEEDTVEEEEEIKLVEEEPKEEIKEADEFDEVINKISRKALLKDFPELEKKYPQLLRAYYGNAEYRKVFPTLDSVKEAKVRLDEFHNIEADLAKGSAASLFKGLKDKSPESFSKVVDNYLLNLREVDQDAFYHVVGNNIREAILAMGTYAQKNKDASDPNLKQYSSDLVTAAQILNSFMFGEEKFTAPTSFKKADTPATNELEVERAKFNEEKLTSHKTEVSTKIDNLLNSTVAKHIDPNNSMPPYIKENAVRDVLAKTKELIDKDSAFQSVLGEAWKKSEKEKFSPESRKKIEDALKSKAQVLLPQVIKLVRSKALQGVGVRKGAEDRKGLLPKRGTSTTPNSKGGNTNNAKVAPEMSTLDFLNRNG